MLTKGGSQIIFRPFFGSLTHIGVNLHKYNLTGYIIHAVTHGTTYNVINNRQHYSHRD